MGFQRGLIMTYDETQYRRAAVRFLIGHAVQLERGMLAGRLAVLAGDAGLFGDGEVLAICQALQEGTLAFTDAEMTWTTPAAAGGEAVIV